MNKSRKKSSAWSLFVIAILLFGVAVLVFLVNTLPDIEANNILRNGTETTADIYDIDNNASSATQMYLKFTYINADGEKVYGETNDAYAADELEEKGFITVDRSGSTYHFDVIPGNTIQVVYLGDKVVAKDYKNRILYSVLAGVAFALGIASFIGFIVMLGKIKKEKNQNNYNNQNNRTYY